jgi:hypothetical protein
MSYGSCQSSLDVLQTTVNGRIAVAEAADKIEVLRVKTMKG